MKTIHNEIELKVALIYIITIDAMRNFVRGIYRQTQAKRAAFNAARVFVFSIVSW